jgi:hypothetical protein
MFFFSGFPTKILYEFLISTEDKNDDTKDSFYEEFEQVFEQFPRYSYEEFATRFQCKGREGGHF